MTKKACKLLLVDDDVSNLRVLSWILSAHADQRLATSGAQALQLAMLDPPDLILVDMQMPGMSGSQFCAELRSSPSLAHVPVLFVTGDISDAARLEALQVGASDFITKPVKPAQLQARVAALLRGAATLEQSKQEAARMLPEAPHQMHTGPARLLVVDDDEAAIETLQHSLRGLGELRVVSSGAAAMSLVAQWRPDIVLLDASMPGMDGYELCQRLKTDAGLQHVPVVFVTRLSEPANETRALDLGAADFISKPFSKAVLKARVRNLLELKRRNDLELFAAAGQGQRLAAERAAAVIEGASDGVVTIDGTKRFVLMNAAAGRMLGVDHPTAPGRLAEDLLGDRLQGVDLDIPATGLRVVLPLPDGSTLPTEVAISHVGTGAMRLTTLVLRDLSDRERLLTESSARAVAEAAHRTKTLMMSFIAHEIGNPLNCIQGFAQLLQHNRESPLNPAQAHRVDMILAGCEQLTALMSDVSALGHFELGKLSVNCAPVDARLVVAGAMMAASAVAEQAQVTLIPPDSAAPTTHVLADSRRLQQCLVNLLSNAIKYNKPGGDVVVRVLGGIEGVEISVTDTGLGMDDSQFGHLFEPFNRLGRQGSATPGSGLGLVVTRQLIEAMGGHLGVTSKVGEGSCFTVHLRQATVTAS
jgi:PleD family two-component response regulator/nitrogen-specific signal transduction histidine kinase